MSFKPSSNTKPTFEKYGFNFAKHCHRNAANELWPAAQMEIWPPERLTSRSPAGNWAAVPGSSHPEECKPAWLQSVLEKKKKKKTTWSKTYSLDGEFNWTWGADSRLLLWENLRQSWSINRETSILLLAFWKKSENFGKARHLPKSLRRWGAP